jgi:NADH-quinone oxidoreductase subunit D
MDFEVPLGSDGDIYARYLCRMEELHQSNRILQQCIDQLPAGVIVSEGAPDLIMPMQSRKVKAESTGYGAALIQLVEDQQTYPHGDVYVSTEVPKGELGFYFISDGKGHPYRMHIRSPSFIHISALTSLAAGEMVADLIANIGSLDVVLGECDR